MPVRRPRSARIMPRTRGILPQPPVRGMPDVGQPCGVTRWPATSSHG
jgi:hypothetical protein